jgi:hypothetical protein
MSRKSRLSETQWPALGYPDSDTPADTEEKLFDRMAEWMEALGVHPAELDAVGEAARRLFTHVVAAGIPPERLTADHDGPFEVRDNPFVTRREPGPKTRYFSTAEIGEAVRRVEQRPRGQTIADVLRLFVAEHAKGKSKIGQERLLKALRTKVDWRRFPRKRKR